MRVSTLSSRLGVSCPSSARALEESRSRYFSATASASAQVAESGQAGPEAIISSGSPRMSDNTTWNTRAGAQACAKRPPLTAERRLRIVLISMMSAPQASSWRVISCNSSPGISGCSNNALPPPESRNSTVSPAPAPATRSNAARVAAKPFSSGIGWPASRQATPGSSPCAWPYLVMTTPPSTRPRQPSAACAICQAALPAATSSTRPPGANPASARRTAASGRTAAMLLRSTYSASMRREVSIQIPF